MRNNYAGDAIGEQALSRDESYLNLNVYNLFIKQDLSDICPISIGESIHHDYTRRGIQTSDCTNLYYIMGGKGTLYLNNDVIRIKAGDFFIVPLGAKASIRADAGVEIPHRWSGFTGLLTHDFERFPRPFTLPEDVVNALCDPQKDGRNLGSRLASDLFLIHSIMQEPEENEPDYVQKVVNWVNTSYMNKLSVTQMAQTLGLDRCHLSRLFKSKMNMSIQDYILSYRLSKAKRYLKHNYSITDTAQLCGFADRANFSKLFTREVGCSPTEWVKIIDWEGWNKPR